MFQCAIRDLGVELCKDPKRKINCLFRENESENREENEGKKEMG